MQLGPGAGNVVVHFSLTVFHIKTHGLTIMETLCNSRHVSVLTLGFTGPDLGHSPLSVVGAYNIFNNLLCDTSAKVSNTDHNPRPRRERKPSLPTQC